MFEIYFLWFNFPLMRCLSESTQRFPSASCLALPGQLAENKKKVKLFSLSYRRVIFDSLKILVGNQSVKTNKESQITYNKNKSNDSQQPFSFPFLCSIL